MKRMLAMCLIAMLMLSMALAVYGEDGNSQNTTVTYTVQETYIVSIPERVDITTGHIDISMSECHLNYPIYLYITSGNYGSQGWKLTSGMNSLRYSIKRQDGSVVEPGCLGTMAANTSISLNIELVDSVALLSAPAGTYTDVLTFSFRDTAE